MQYRWFGGWGGWVCGLVWVGFCWVGLLLFLGFWVFRIGFGLRWVWILWVCVVGGFCCNMGFEVVCVLLVGWFCFGFGWGLSCVLGFGCSLSFVFVFGLVGLLCGFL